MQIHLLWSTIMKMYLLLMTFASAGLTAANHVVKRSDGVNPLQVVVDKLLQKVEALVPRVTALENSVDSRAAFLGQLPMPSDGKINVPDLAPIRFTEVFDIGDGFEPTTGVYSVKYSGIFAINFQMFPDFTGRVAVDLKVNGNILVRVRGPDGTSTYPPSCSSGLSVRVKAGDKLWLETFAQGLYWGLLPFLPVHHTPPS